MTVRSSFVHSFHVRTCRRARSNVFSTAGGLPTLDSVDLSLLGAQAQAKMSKPLAHKNVALTKVSAAACMLSA